MPHAEDDDQTATRADVTTYPLDAYPQDWVRRMLRQNFHANSMPTHGLEFGSNYGATSGTNPSLPSFERRLRQDLNKPVLFSLIPNAIGVDYVNHLGRTNEKNVSATIFRTLLTTKHVVGNYDGTRYAYAEDADSNDNNMEPTQVSVEVMLRHMLCLDQLPADTVNKINESNAFDRSRISFELKPENADTMISKIADMSMTQFGQRNPLQTMMTYMSTDGVTSRRLTSYTRCPMFITWKYDSQRAEPDGGESADGMGLLNEISETKLDVISMLEITAQPSQRTERVTPRPVPPLTPFEIGKQDLADYQTKYFELAYGLK